MDLCKFLSSNEFNGTLYKNVATLYVQSLERNAEEAMGRFAEFTFHAGGWLTYKYSSSEFPPVEKITQLKEHQFVNLHPLITQYKFQQSFSSFLTVLFELNESSVLYKDEFVRKIMQIFDFMNESWDSFKLIAVLLGMRLAQSVNKECMKWQAVESSVSSSQLSNSNKKLNYLTGIRDQILAKIHPKVPSCPFRSLDRCFTDSLRNLNNTTTPCPFHLSLVRACNLQSSAILVENWIPIILNGLRHKNVDIQGLALVIIFQTLNDAKKSSFKQRVFKHLKSDIVHVLSSRSELSEFCLRILNNCIGLFDERDRLSPLNLETILYYLYDKSQTLATLAGEIACWSRFVPMNADPVEMIVHLVEINHESFIKCEELIMDSIFHLIKTYLKWADWMKVIKHAPADYIPSFMRMLCAYTRKSTSDFTPRLRNCKVFQQLMDASEVASNKSIYTSLVSDYWFELLELPKITNNSKAVASLLKMIQFFDASILECEEKVENLAYVCLAFFTISKDDDVIDQACSGLASLKKLSKSEHPVVKKVVDAAILTSVAEFIDSRGEEANVIMVQKKFLSVTKHFDVDDNQLWGKCCDKLRSAPSLDIDSNSKVQQIGVLMPVLFQLTMKKLSSAKFQTTPKGKAEPNAILNDCTSRAVALKTLLKIFLRPQNDPEVRILACMYLLAFLGYITTHKQLWPQVSLDEEEVNSLVNYAVTFMDSDNCINTIQRSAIMSPCCRIIRSTSQLISRGAIDIHCITPFLKCVGKSSLHDDFLIAALNKYAAAFPNCEEKLTAAISNSYIVAVENVLPLLNMSDDRVHEFMISKLKDFLRQLTKFLISGNKFADKSIMKVVSTRVHSFVIEFALRPNGFRMLLEILADISRLLSADDVDSVLAVLRQYKTDNASDVTNYEHFLKRLNLQN